MHMRRIRPRKERTGLLQEDVVVKSVAPQGAHAWRRLNRPRKHKGSGFRLAQDTGAQLRYSGTHIWALRC